VHNYPGPFTINKLGQCGTPRCGTLRCATLWFGGVFEGFYPFAYVYETTKSIRDSKFVRNSSRMSVIKIPILFAGSKGETVLYSLFDIGANLSCINPEYLEKLETPVKLGRKRNIYTAAEGHYIEISERVPLDFYLEDVLLSDEFLVVPGLSEEAIIGAATMQKWRIKLDFEHDTVHVDPKVAKMQLKKTHPIYT